MALIHGKGAAIYATSTPSVTRTEQGMTSAGGDNKTWYITNQDYRFWDFNHPVTIKDDGVDITSSVTIHYAGGYIVSGSALSGTITATFYNFPYAQIADAYSWSFSSKGTTVETTVFGQNGVRRAVTIHDFNASLGGYHDYGLWANYALNGTMLGFSLHEKGTYNAANSTGWRYDGYGFIDSKVDSSGTDMMKDTVTVQSHLPWYYHIVP